jgi:hypothetical protein
MDKACAAPATVSERERINMPLWFKPWEGDAFFTSPETGLELLRKCRGVTVCRSGAVRHSSSISIVLELRHAGCAPNDGKFNEALF